MLLAIDIGNSNINLGVVEGKRLLERFAIPTAQESYSRQLKRIFSRYKADQAIICSVVPEATRRLKSALRSFIARDILVAGEDFPVPLKNCYRKPAQVGQDRLVNAFAGVLTYQAPLIVVDFGTAVTFDVVSAQQEYLGGMIFPGLNISLDALGERAALLPRVKLGRPKEFIGRDTQNSILSGLVYGISALVDEMIDKIKQEIGNKSAVIFTGGDAALISGYCRQKHKLDPELTLKGLTMLWFYYNRENEKNS